ncbi:MAG: tetratricopeptide repeat protein [Bdellovibrionota bacterium]
MKKNIQATLLSLVFLLVLAGCLQTRSDVSEQDQNAVYAKKNAENQMESQAAAAPVDEKDELIRNLIGRVEVLESQLVAQQEAKLASGTQDSQKILLLQEALAKMETQIQNLENNNSEDETADISSQSSDDLADAKAKATAKSDAKSELKKDQKKDLKINKQGTYETAEQYYSKQDWKKAIISFQKYTDESPRGKHVADAKYKIGLCFQKLGMKEEAMAFYEEVVANYAKTDAGKKSKTLLSKIKK